MNTRPKPGETDDDLIRQNAEFLKKTKRKAEESGESLEGMIHKKKTLHTYIFEQHNINFKILDDLKKQKSQECGNDCIFNDPEVILSK